MSIRKNEGNTMFFVNLALLGSGLGPKEKESIHEFLSESIIFTLLLFYCLQNDQGVRL